MTPWSLSGWATFAIPTNVQKRLYKFLLKKAIGQFLARELELEHFDVELAKGSVELRDLRLNVKVLNKLMADMPFQIVSGDIAVISASIPWTNFWAADTVLEIKGLRISIVPYSKPKTAESDPRDKMPIMSSSVSFAGDFLQHEIPPDEDEELRSSIYHSFHSAAESRTQFEHDSRMFSASQSQAYNNQPDAHQDAHPDMYKSFPSPPFSPNENDMEGLQVLTRLIDKIMARVKVVISDTVVRLHFKSTIEMTDKDPTPEHMLRSVYASMFRSEVRGTNDYYLDLQLPSITMQDETPGLGDDPSNLSPTSQMDSGSSSVLLPPIGSDFIKTLRITDPTVWLRQEEIISDIASDISSASSAHGAAQPEEDSVNVMEAGNSDAVDDTNTSAASIQDFTTPTASVVQSHFATFHANPRRVSATETKVRYEALVLTTDNSVQTIRFKRHPQSDLNLQSELPSPGPRLPGPFSAPTSRPTHPSNTSRPNQVPEPPFATELEYHIPCLKSLLYPKQVMLLAELFLCAGQTEKISKFDQQQDDSSEPTTKALLSHLDHASEISRPAELGRKDTSNSLLHEDDYPTMSAAARSIHSTYVLSDASRAPIPRLKFKFICDKIDLYFLLSTPQVVPNQSTFDHPSKSLLGMGHLKLSLVKLLCRFKECASQHPLAPRATARYNTGSREDRSEISRVTIDVQLNNLYFGEHLSFHPQTPRPSAPTSLTYLPIIEFDHSLPDCYDQGSGATKTDFPSFLVIPRGGKHAIDDSFAVPGGRESRHYAFRLSVKTKASYDMRETETKCDLAPVQVYVDVRLVDRLEEYLRKLSTVFQEAVVRTADVEPTSSMSSGGQLVYEDLENRDIQVRRDARGSHQWRLRCEFLRVYFIAPDMSACNLRDENTNSSHRDILIADLLGVNVKNAIQDSDNDFTNEQVDDAADDGRGHYTSKIPKVKLECATVNVFMKFDEDHTAFCWFTGKAYDLSTHHESGAKSESKLMVPTIEITFRSEDSAQEFLKSQGEEDQFFTRRFSTYTQDQGVRFSDEREDLYTFKQNTVNTSLFVLSCHFPYSKLYLTKRNWDIVQTIQQDLIVWQPRFLQPSHDDLGAGWTGSEGNAKSSLTESIIRTYAGSEFRTNKDRNEKLESSVMSESVEKLGQRQEQPKATLLTIKANLDIADFTFDIVPPAQGAAASQGVASSFIYNLRMRELDWFSVAKHQGKSQSIVCLEMGDILLFDITEKTSRRLLRRTVPVSASNLYRQPALSVLSHLSVDSEVNIQEKNSYIVVDGMTWDCDLDIGFIEHFVFFQSPPADLNILDMPLQITKVFATVNDSSIEYNPSTIPAHAALLFDDLKVNTTIIPDSPSQGATIAAAYTKALLIDDTALLLSDEATLSRMSSHKTPYSLAFWKTKGMAEVLFVEYLDLTFRIGNGAILPKFELELANENFTIEGCADSFQGMLKIIAHAANHGDQSSTATTAASAKGTGRKPPSLDFSTDMLASVEEHAFQRRGSADGNAAEDDELTFVDEYYTLGEQSLEQPMYYTGKDLDASMTASTRLSQSMAPRKPRRGVVLSSYDDTIRLLDNDLEQLEFEPNHFAPPDPEEEADDEKLNPTSVWRIKIKDANITWRMLDGLDWVKSQEALEKKVARLRRSLRRRSDNSDTSRSSEASPSSPMEPSLLDRFSLAPYLAQDANEPGSPSSRSIRSEGREDGSSPRPSSVRSSEDVRERSSKHPYSRTAADNMELRLKHVSANYNVFPDSEQTASKLQVFILDVEVTDNVRASSWHKFLSYMRPDSSTRPRESKSNMLRFELCGVRPFNDEVQEYRLKIKLLPIRLYVDQNALNFLIRFLAFEEPTDSPAMSSASRSEEQMYFQHVEVQALTLKVDYKPRALDYGNLMEGRLVELVNLFHLDGAQVDLNTLKLTGIHGWGRLIEAMAKEWLPHIKSTQIPNVVSGVSPIRSLVNLGNGVADLILLPVEQYKKDGRILRGVQKGTRSFAKATTMEAIKIGSRLAAGTQVILENADQMFGRGQGSQGEIIAQGETTMYSKFADQPSDIGEGLEYAYKSLRSNLGTAAETIYAVPMEVYEQESVGGTAKAVVRAVPVTVIKPMIGVTEALSNVLIGIRNSIDPVMKLQNEDGDYEHIKDTLTHVASLHLRANEWLTSHGYEVQTLRVATNRVREWCPHFDAQTWINDMVYIDKVCESVGIHFMSIGPVDGELLLAVPEFVKRTKYMNVSGAIELLESGNIDMECAQVIARQVLAVSRLDDTGGSNFRFCAIANLKPGCPFFPSGYAASPIEGKKGTSFAVGLECSDLVGEAFRSARETWERQGGRLLDLAKQSLQEKFEGETSRLERLLLEYAASTHQEYTGIDVSIAPSCGPDNLDTSLATAYEQLPLHKPEKAGPESRPYRFGDPGTMTISALITSVLKRFQEMIKTTGYCGLMMPVMEDVGIAQAWPNLRWEQLLAWSAVCGCGLDCVPVAGNTDPTRLGNVLADMATMAYRLNKPLSARLFPIPNSSDTTHFNDPLLVNTSVALL